MMCGERIAKDLKVLRLEIPGVFWNLLEVWIGTPLADFVTDLGDAIMVFGIIIEIIGCSCGRKAVDT